MNSKSLTVIALRFLVIYLFFQIIPSVGFTLYSIVVEPESRTFSIIGYQLAMVTLYLVPAIILFFYSNSVARKITNDIPNEIIKSDLNSINLLSILISASAVFVIISSIPGFINQLYSLITFYQTELLLEAEKYRFNQSIIGVLGITFEIVIAVIVFIKSKKLASYWEKL
jgi:hypothetical protein